MLSHRLYYTLKPHLPWSLRMGVRRILADRTRNKHQHVWPINEVAGRAPANWRGWPNGKKFALVLTHDVEGTLGLGKCRQLAELEIQHGFRSSFNFVPEGEYSVPADLRAWLREQGFEVGVHDLQHDGRLFRSREEFKAKALRINRYLREWGSSGFRSGFMLRNLDWLHRLDIKYDSSTFDTDPFELQSNGVGTIFPFWIPTPDASVESRSPMPNPNGATAADTHGGYVELPYTLPQDSTLFLVLRERSPEIWLRKLDWIAENGGMALVNVHPDYMDFDNRGGKRVYPARTYADFLQYVKQRYQNDYWHVHAKELAAWFDQQRSALVPATAASASTAPITIRSDPPANLRGKKAAVILYSYFPSDPRPRRAAEALVEAGMSVDFLCLSAAPTDAPKETVNGITVYRRPMKRRRGGKWTYIWQYGRFLLSAFWFLTRRGLWSKYDVVHVHNMPDFLVFSALIPKLRGSRVILDLHDPMPELMMSIYQLQAERRAVRMLFRLERWSIGFSNLALTPNITFKNLFVTRSCVPDKMQIVMNSPEEKIFDRTLFPVTTPRDPQKEFRIMHHGSILQRHGIDLLVEAVAQVRSKIPGVRLDIYGSREPFLDTVLETARRLGIEDIVHYHGAKNQAGIAQAITECDLGVVPNRKTPFTEINFPTRLFEYLAMDRPVIAPATTGIRDYFSDAQMLFFEPENVADLAARILWVWEHPAESREVVRHGLEVYREHLWSREKSHFVNLVSQLCARA
ncbi:MAG TPA: glycosyltransferase [Candidatus Didemnitutus sp.]|nr:glycosyltransferase [Candidatus Didemnitutus sp.]